MQSFAQQAQAIQLSTESVAQTAESWTVDTVPDDETLEQLQADTSGDIEEAKAAYESALKIYNGISTEDSNKKQALEILNLVRTARDYAIANGDRAIAAYQLVIGDIQPRTVEMRPDGNFYLNPDRLGRFIINGTDNDDTILIGQPGDDIYYIFNNQRIYLDHTQGSEVIVQMKGGNDRFEARGVNNGNFTFKIDGGDGDDILSGSNGDDYIVGGEGNDKIYSDGGSDTIDVRDSYNAAAANHDEVYNGSFARGQTWIGEVDYKNAGEINVIANDEVGSDSINPFVSTWQAEDARNAASETTVNGQQQAFDNQRLNQLKQEEYLQWVESLNRVLP